MEEQMQSACADYCVNCTIHSANGKADRFHDQLYHSFLGRKKRRNAGLKDVFAEEFCRYNFTKGNV
jgi:hypothetical protein